MTELRIDDDIAERVQALAEQEQRSINAVLREMLTLYTRPESRPTPNHNWLQVMARMAAEDESGVWDNFSPDLAANSRDILRENFAADLRKRMTDDADTR
jgi:predicted transcriptional regulator